MWFNNLLFFTYEKPLEMSIDELKTAMEDYHLKSCPPHAKSVMGFDSLSNHEPDIRIYSTNDCHVGVLTQSQRLLPSSVLNAALEQKKQAYEFDNQRPMNRAETLQAKEMLEFELLPKAFIVDKKRWFYIDTKKQWVVVNSAQPAQASDVLSYLIKVTGSLGYSPLALSDALPELMKQWLQVPLSLGHGFELGKHCQLVHLDEDKSTYNCKDIKLHHQELCELLDKGFAVASIELVWEEKLSFSLTDQFVFKKVKCLDCLTETLKEHRDLATHWAQFDADMALLAGELRNLIADLHSVVQVAQKEKLVETETPAVA